jgi:FkbM family methyltransferase
MADRTRIWIDVGAHLGEKTFAEAERDRSLVVYAFEPNLSLVLRRAGRLPNWIVLPYAVGEEDGAAAFHFTRLTATSSLLPFHEPGREAWLGGEELQIERVRTVPVIRLDTFLEVAGIGEAEFLKIDAQGADLSVVKSAGERIRSFRKITLEVQITPVELYAGGSRKEDVVEYLAARGFALASVEVQSRGQEENLTFLRR